MYLDRISAVDSETRLITRDSLAARQWEIVLAGLDAAPGQTAWPSRPILSEVEWLCELFESIRSRGGPNAGRHLLGPHQTERLWRRVISESGEGDALISSNGVAVWARAARRRLFDFGLDPASQGQALWQRDHSAFLDWNRRFETALDAAGWIDGDSLVYRINRSGLSPEPVAVWLLDPWELTPEAAQNLNRHREAGCSVETVEPDGQAAAVEALIAADPVDELRRVVEWASARLEADDASRLAVVFPDLATRRTEISTLFADAIGSENVTGAGGPAIGDIAAFGAAMTAIRLVTGRATFAELSRWLRSPFFTSGDDDRERRAAELEIALRTDSRCQQDFGEAWRRYGLRNRFRQILPDMTRQLDEAFARLPHRATPTAWTSIWQSCLSTLGWLGFDADLSAALRQGWDGAWARFCELTPVLGTIGPGQALENIEEILATETVYEPLALTGVTLLSSLAEIGPGYSAAWISGFTADAEPASESPNPLLPWPLQAAHGMPGADPDNEIARSVRRLENLRRRVAEATFSCPARIEDQPQMANPLIDGWRAAGTRAGGHGSSRLAQRIAARSWLETADEAPPLEGRTIPGGTRTLDTQAVNPVKAFCQARLGAAPLETPARGIDARLRGLLVHRVLELLLDPAATGEPATRIDAAVDQAFGEMTQPGNPAWEQQLRAERSRLESIVRRFLEREGERPEFETIAVEQRHEVALADWRLKCRIDRIDRLVTGETLIIDYKTGQVGASGWFDDRLSDCQLPVYALGGEVAGIATIRLTADAIEYRAAGAPGLGLPGRQKAFEPPEWEGWIETWQEQIMALMAEFAGGDVRLRSDAGEFVSSHEREHAGGAFAPLTRVGELR